MAQFLTYLNESQLVADFQRYCGIIPGPAPHWPNRKAPSQQVNTDNEPEINGSVGDGKIANGIHENGPYRRAQNQVSSGEKFEESTSEEELEKEYHVTNKTLYYLFQFAASLGNEVFYITFYPFWFWNIDGYVGRRMCIFWCFFMYVGQATKDIVKWPRPRSPPVIHLEKRYALEYGMPSTHAMVGAGIPFTILYFTHERYIFPTEYGLAGAVVWCTLVALSRLYLGMHSILDVLAGLTYVFLLMPLIFPWLDAADEFMLNSPWSPYISILLPLTLAICYPKLDKWSTARGDTTVVLAVCAGVSLGHWFSFQYGFMQRCTDPPPYEIIYPTWLWFGQIWARLVIGVVILVATRAVMKALVYSVICKISGTSKKDLKASEQLYVEIPDKFITYTMIAFNTVYLAPQIFRILGIERETFFTEI